MENRKKLIIKLSVTVVGLLLMLTFFSNTIHNLNIAGVVVGIDTDGIITTTTRGEGMIEFPKHRNIFAAYAGRIQLFAEDGDHVYEGDLLFEVQIDRMQVLERIASLRNMTYSLPWINRAEVQREIERYQRLLNTDGVIAEYAPCDGVVRFAQDAPENNGLVGAEQIIMRLDMMEEAQVMVVVYFPESLGMEPELGSRRTVRLNIPSMNEIGIPAQIERMMPANGRLRTEISFSVPGHPVSGGERVEVLIEDFSALAERVLPNYAIREDQQGEFILYVQRERNTFLGYSYFARRAGISVWQRGDWNTSFLMFSEIEGPIILQSDRPIAVGDRIRVVGER